MKTKTSKISIILFILLSLTACKNENNKNTNSTTKENESSINQDTQNNIQVPETSEASIRWNYIPKGNNANGEPTTQVQLIVNNKIHNLVTINFSPSDFSEIEKKYYSSLKFPAKTLSITRGYNAGYGVDYYVLQNQNELQVFTKTLYDTDSEEREAKLLKTINIE